MDIIEKLEQISEQLDELQDYLDSLTTRMSVADSKVSDIQHFIENTPITAFEGYRLIKEFKEVLYERRKIKKDLEFNRIFSQQQSKMLSKENRKFLIVELKKSNKKMDTKYNNRIYGEDELNKIVAGKEKENGEGENL